MLKKSLLALAFAGAAAMPAQAAVTISAVNGPAPAIYTGAFTFSFDSGTEAAWNGDIFFDSLGGQRAQPAGSDTAYASVGSTPGQGSGVSPATLSLAAFGSINSISFLWGSIDDYNSLTVLGSSNPGNGGNPYIFTGTDVTSSPFGNQTDPQKNKIVTLTFTGADRDTVTGLQFASSQNSFEFDSVTVNSAVPEPATWAMMIAGFGLMGAAMRRRPRVNVAFA